MSKVLTLMVFASLVVGFVPAVAAAADAEGRWSTGRKAVFILHQDGQKLTGLIDSGPGERKYKIVDGEIHGDEVLFYILHEDKDDPEVIENSGKSFRNTAKGSIAGDELTISGAREGTGQHPYKLILKRLSGK